MGGLGFADGFNPNVELRGATVSLRDDLWTIPPASNQLGCVFRQMLQRFAESLAEHELLGHADNTRPAPHL